MQSGRVPDFGRAGASSTFLQAARLSVTGRGQIAIQRLVLGDFPLGREKCDSASLLVLPSRDCYTISNFPGRVCCLSMIPGLFPRFRADYGRFTSSKRDRITFTGDRGFFGTLTSECLRQGGCAKNQHSLPLLEGGTAA